MRPLLFVVLIMILPQLSTAASSPILPYARHTIDLVYNMEFDAALKSAQMLIDRMPQHPAGYFYRAATFWQWRLITRDKSLRTELLERFRADIEQVLKVAEQLPASETADAAFYLGAAYGMQARMYVVEKQFLDALRMAKKGGEHLRRCVEIDPTYHEAYLGLGLYHYAITTAPGLIRGVLQLLIGIKGDRAKGLEQLERARTKSVLAAPEAASILAKIYISSRERRYYKAHHLLQHLVRQYPNNFDYRFRFLFVSVSLQRWEQARRISEALIADIANGKPYYSSQWIPLLRYRIAETYVLEGDSATAGPLLERLRSEDADAALRAWIMLRLGNLYDLQADRQSALAAYRQVEGDGRAEELAKQYEAAPFTAGENELKPLDTMIYIDWKDVALPGAPSKAERYVRDACVIRPNNMTPCGDG